MIPTASRRRRPVDDAIRIAQKFDFRGEGRISAVAVPHVVDVIGDARMGQHASPSMIRSTAHFPGSAVRVTFSGRTFFTRSM
jgi:hypothetical protein